MGKIVLNAELPLPCGNVGNQSRCVTQMEMSSDSLSGRCEFMIQAKILNLTRRSWTAGKLVTK